MISIKDLAAHMTHCTLHEKINIVETFYFQDSIEKEKQLDKNPSMETCILMTKCFRKWVLCRKVPS
jgi:DNA-binding XRE family transcriptional regulator